MNVLQSGIAKFISADVPTVNIDAPVQEAVDALKNSPYGAVYAVSADRKLAGVITSCDMIKLGTSDATRPKKVSELATTTKIVGIRDDAELWQLLKIMNGENSINKRLDRIPVVSADKKIVGVVDRRALRSALETVQVPLSGSMGL
ncbi:MAG: CBS domain-containing protein [Opitutae bacterium]|nr:CBS domain-containing protein [Opitutae bacterium]